MAGNQGNRSHIFCDADLPHVGSIATMRGQGLGGGSWNRKLHANGTPPKKQKKCVYKETTVRSDASPFGDEHEVHPHFEACYSFHSYLSCVIVPPPAGSKSMDFISLVHRVSISSVNPLQSPASRSAKELKMEGKPHRVSLLVARHHQCKEG